MYHLLLCQKNVAACHGTLAGSCVKRPLALHSQNGSRHTQCHTWPLWPVNRRNFHTITVSTGQTTRFHTFGCPVFVLDPSLQQGHKTPIWRPWARQATYLGLSQWHAQTVPIVLILITGLCSPKYHIVFNDYFMTMQRRTTNELPLTWQDLFTHNQINILDGELDLQATVKLSSEWDTEHPDCPPIDTVPSDNSTLAPEGD